MSVDSKMTAIADKIRGLLGLTGEMGLDAMATNLTTEQANIDAALSAIANKGVTVPDGSTSDALAALIDGIEAGGGGGGEYEISTGIITPAEDTESLSFEHGLSKAPNFVHIFLPIGYSAKSYGNALRTLYYKSSYNSSFSPGEKYDVYTSRSSTSNYYHENAKQLGDVYFSVDDTTVTAPACGFNTSTKRKWVSGNPYHWICIAGEVVFPYQ